MKKALKKLNPGDIFTFAGERFVILEHLEDGTFVLTEGSIGDSPFQKEDTDTSDDYSKSTVKERVDMWVAELPRNSAEAAAILPFVLDLRPTDLSDGYGTIEVRAAPLTLWQYGEYNEVIPLLDGWWWLATPLWSRWLKSTRSNGAGSTWNVLPDGGCGSDYCATICSVRPALKLDSELSVSVDSDDDCDTDCENCDCEDCGCSNLNDLSWISDEALLRELCRRLSGGTDGEGEE